MAKQEDHLEATAVRRGRAGSLINVVTGGWREEDGFRIYSKG